jgi:hypothetical protein
MLIAGIIVVCIVLAVLAFVLPKTSMWPQKGVDKTLSVPQQGAGKAPGKLGQWLQKPFSSSRKATNKSASKGREGRSKLPM